MKVQVKVQVKMKVKVQVKVQVKGGSFSPTLTLMPSCSWSQGLR